MRATTRPTCHQAVWRLLPASSRARQGSADNPAARVPAVRLAKTRASIRLLFVLLRFPERSVAARHSRHTEAATKATRLSPHDRPRRAETILAGESVTIP